MDRRQFLDRHWIPYPTLPKGWLMGRLFKISGPEVQMQMGSKDVTCYRLPKLPQLVGLRSSPAAKIEVSVLKPGDWVGLSPEGEILLLAPAIRDPRPVKFQDQQVRDWSRFLSQVRSHFLEQGFLEVPTPTLVPCPGTEPFIDPFACGDKYLPTSPELHLKKALSMGAGPIFEIRPCFRRGEISEIHQPEFWMLEWYRPGQDLSVIQADVVRLVESLSGKTLNFECKSMAELFQEQLGFTLKPWTTQAELQALGRGLGLKFGPDEPWDDSFNLIFVDQIEKSLGRTRGLFLRDYPPEMAALARLTPEGWGDRFEFYWQGLELANAFHELNDPQEQRRRALADNLKKQKAGRSPVGLDEDFFLALEEGMPPAAGIALGLERLFMGLGENRNFSSFRIFSES